MKEVFEFFFIDFTKKVGKFVEDFFQTSFGDFHVFFFNKRFLKKNFRSFFFKQAF